MRLLYLGPKHVCLFFSVCSWLKRVEMFVWWNMIVYLIWKGTAKSFQRMHHSRSSCQVGNRGLQVGSMIEFPISLVKLIIATSHDLTRKWWFSKGNPVISGFSRLVKYYNLPRSVWLQHGNGSSLFPSMVKLVFQRTSFPNGMHRCKFNMENSKWFRHCSFYRNHDVAGFSSSISLDARFTHARQRNL